mmetsp:Transcript_1670/g.1840  ORF Transcript_1670/g.1840 Transcript_1670/m.1840 type:complete len:107 (-) Transcript_1670:35-355(-)
MNNEVIKGNEARTKYGFKSMVVYHSKCMTNACDVEDAMQAFLMNEFMDPHRDDTTIKGLKLGRRFWRAVAMGAKKSDEIGHYKTFVTFSLNIGEHYGEDGTIKVLH